MRGQRPAELVVGSVQLGLPYGIANRTGKPPRETALRLVKRAADAGVAVFDTARAYGDAEDRLGEALEGRSVRTITKLSPLSELPPDASSEAACAGPKLKFRIVAATVAASVSFLNIFISVVRLF